MGDKTHISIVIPVYGCSACLEQLYQRLQKSLTLITDDFEIILVNDASPDDSWSCIQQLAESDNRVKGVNLSRNFGQHYAISAGLDYARGDWVVVMDCDLQDQPEMIKRLYNKAQEGFDVVVGIRSQRKDNFLKKLVPENPTLYRHNSEGKDDMPAHIKSMLTQTSLTVPVRDKKMNLGTWQGIFLLEHRINSIQRKINLTLIGE